MRTNFSQALDLYSGCKTSQKVRPHELCYDTLANEDDAIGKECEEEGSDEGRVIKSQKILYQPSQQEWDDHMRTHIPLRK